MRSEFSDVFDVAHFKAVLRHDIPIISTLPPRHMRRQFKQVTPPVSSPTQWFVDNLAEVVSA